SRPTVRRAIQELVDKGLLVRRRGIGTQVVHGQVTRSVELTSLYEDLQRSGQSPTTTVISRDIVDADEQVATTLGIAVGDPVVHLVRLRSADKVPIAVLDNTLPSEFAELSEADFQEHGLYQLFRARGVNIRVAKQRITAREATAAECELLSLPNASPVLAMSRTAFDSSGRAVEFGQHCYSPDLYSFEITLVDN
ncbi:MAG: GntR family transcriptional regulator, partial [Beutenbergiaceae bacterium]